MRLRFYPLGHSDPQLYTQTHTTHPQIGGGGSGNGHLLSAAGLTNSGGRGVSGRRSFLSSSPLTFKLRVSFKELYLIILI